MSKPDMTAPDKEILKSLVKYQRTKLIAELNYPAELYTAIIKSSEGFSISQFDKMYNYLKESRADIVKAYEVASAEEAAQVMVFKTTNVTRPTAVPEVELLSSVDMTTAILKARYGIK